MACAELVLPGDFDHCHHGGPGLGSDRAHTVSLYRQELEVVQEWFSVLLGGMPYGRLVDVLPDRKALRPFGTQGKKSACATGRLRLSRNWRGA